MMEINLGKQKYLSYENCLLFPHGEKVDCVKKILSHPRYNHIMVLIHMKSIVIIDILDESNI